MPRGIMSSHSIDSLLRAFLVLSSCAMLYVNAYSLEQGQIQLTWEKGVGELVRSRLAERLAQSPPSLQPMMISVSGIPGSGKSVSSLVLGQELSDLGCVVMPFDGYHYPRQHLLGLPNAKDALYRRGAPDTFDSAGLMRDLMRIRDGNEPLITVPGFDHATADPEPDEHVFVRSQHKVVICEGLYLLHDQDGWEKISSCFDFSIFVQADVDICMDRLKIRNQCIPGYTPEEIARRVDEVDRINALTVERSKTRADLIVQSAAMLAAKS